MRALMLCAVVWCAVADANILRCVRSWFRMDREVALARFEVMDNVRGALRSLWGEPNMAYAEGVTHFTNVRNPEARAPRALWREAGGDDKPIRFSGRGGKVTLEFDEASFANSAVYRQTFAPGTIASKITGKRLAQLTAHSFEEALASGKGRRVKKNVPGFGEIEVVQGESGEMIYGVAPIAGGRQYVIPIPEPIEVMGDDRAVTTTNALVVTVSPHGENQFRVHDIKPLLAENTAARKASAERFTIEARLAELHATLAKVDKMSKENGARWPTAPYWEWFTDRAGGSFLNAFVLPSVYGAGAGYALSRDAIGTFVGAAVGLVAGSLGQAAVFWNSQMTLNLSPHPLVTETWHFFRTVAHNAHLDANLKRIKALPPEKDLQNEIAALGKRLAELTPRKFDKSDFENPKPVSVRYAPRRGALVDYWKLNYDGFTATERDKLTALFQHAEGLGLSDEKLDQFIAVMNASRDYPLERGAAFVGAPSVRGGDLRRFDGD